MDLKLKKEKGKEGEIVGYLQLIPLISAVVCVIGAAAVCIWQLIREDEKENREKARRDRFGKLPF